MMSKIVLSGMTLLAILAAPGVPALSAQSLTPEQARDIVAPQYDALNEPLKKDVPALLARANVATRANDA